MNEAIKMVEEAVQHLPREWLDGSPNKVDVMMATLNRVNEMSFWERLR